MPTIDFPRSDAPTTGHPVTDSDSDNAKGWHDKVSTSDLRYKSFTAKLGQYLAETWNKPNPASWTANLPRDYALYAYRRRQGYAGPHNAAKSYIYLYGSKYRVRFRSVAEFLPHAEWLMDEKYDMDDHSSCRCRTSGNSRRSLAGTPSGSPRPSKRPAISSDLSVLELPLPVKRPTLNYDFSEEEGDVAIEPQRVADVGTQDKRPYRKGELVWLEIPKRDSPAGSGLPTITHWPALITDTLYKTKNSTLPSGHPRVGGIKITRYHSYSMRILGYFDGKESIVGETANILPWKAGEQIMRGSGPGGWRTFVEAGEDMMRAAMPAAAMSAAMKLGEPESGHGTTIEERWKSHWGKRIPFTSLGDQWEAGVIRMGMAVRQAMATANCYCLTDQIEPSAEFLSDSEKRKQTAWQGIYWGGERIWADDTVRLKKSRSDLPTDILPLPKDNLGVVLRIHSIDVHVDDTPDSATGCHEWFLKASGDLYELYPSSKPSDHWFPSEAIAKPGTAQSEFTFAMISPPKGYAFRRLNPEGVDAIIDFTDIAGRVYPNLVECPHFKPLNSWDPVCVPDQTTLSLVGLASGAFNCKRPEVFDHGLYSIVDNSSMQVERHYLALYKSWLGRLPADT